MFVGLSKDDATAKVKSQMMMILLLKKYNGYGHINLFGIPHRESIVREAF